MLRQSFAVTCLATLLLNTACSKAKTQDLKITPLAWQELPRGCSLYFYNNSNTEPLVWATFPKANASNNRLLVGINGKQREAYISTYTDTRIEAENDGYKVVLSVKQWDRVGYELQKGNGLLTINQRKGSQELRRNGTAKRGC